MAKKTTKKKVIEKNCSDLAYKPNNFAVYITCKGKAFIRWFESKLKEYEDEIHKAAQKEFKKYPNLKRIIIEVYEDVDTKRIRVFARTESSLPPKGIVMARCLKYRVSRKKSVIPACEYIGTRWDFSAHKEPNNSIMKQLGFDKIK